jgi:hypothetical protein
LRARAPKANPKKSRPASGLFDNAPAILCARTNRVSCSALPQLRAQVKLAHRAAPSQPQPRAVEPALARCSPAALAIGNSNWQRQSCHRQSLAVSLGSMVEPPSYIHPPAIQ